MDASEEEWVTLAPVISVLLLDRGHPFRTQGMWLWARVEMSAAHWEERSTGRYILLSVPGNTGVKLSFFLSFFHCLDGCSSVSIVLAQLHLKSDISDSLSPVHLRHVILRTQANVENAFLPHGVVGWEGGDRCAPTITAAAKYLFYTVNMHGGRTFGIGSCFPVCS